jgi:hypothetical protein
MECGARFSGLTVVTTLRLWAIEGTASCCQVDPAQAVGLVQIRSRPFGRSRRDTARQFGMMSRQVL